MEQRNGRKTVLSAQKRLERTDAGQEAALEDYCRDYKAFLDTGKTERLCVREGIRQAQAGDSTLYQGDGTEEWGQDLFDNRGKMLLLAVIGSEKLDHGAQIAAAHIDSPRLDLKPNPSMRRRSWPTAKPITTAVSASTSGWPFPWSCGG